MIDNQFDFVEMYRVQNFLLYLQLCTFDKVLRLIYCKIEQKHEIKKHNGKFKWNFNFSFSISVRDVRYLM